MEKKVLTVQETFEEMESIQLGSFTNPVHREFINDTLIEAQKCEAVRTELARQLTALKAAYDEEMQASLLMEIVQRLTQEVYDLANQRGKQQTALKSGLRAMQGVPVAQKVAAAIEMFELMHKYDLHTGQNVDEQTAIIDSFILDVEENHAETMQATGMSELFEQLKIWNQRVCDKVIERDEAKVGMGVGRMANARKASDEAWRELRRAVNAYAYVNGYEPYSEFIGYMNVLIVRYKRTHLGQQAESPEAGVGGTTGGENNGGTTNTPTEDNEEDSSNDDDEYGFDEDLRKN